MDENENMARIISDESGVLNAYSDFFAKLRQDLNVFREDIKNVEAGNE